MKLTLFATSVVALGALASPAFATPGFVALEGSDAIAFHSDGSYTPQLFKYLQGGSAKNVLVYNPTGVINLSSITGGVGTTDTTTLTGVKFSDYSALYIESPGGCCTANNTVLNGFGASVLAFIGAGGNLSIENYVGGTFDGTVAGGANPAGTIVAGFCSDLEKVNANGIAKGFSQPPVDHCCSHQAYESKYWGSQGYISLINADPSFTYEDGSNSGSSFSRSAVHSAKCPSPRRSRYSVLVSRGSPRDAASRQPKTANGCS